MIFFWSRESEYWVQGNYGRWRKGKFWKGKSQKGNAQVLPAHRSGWVLTMHAESRFKAPHLKVKGMNWTDFGLKKKSLELISNQVMKIRDSEEINRIHSLQHVIHSVHDTIQNYTEYNKSGKWGALPCQSEWERGRRGRLWYLPLVSLPIRSGYSSPSHGILNFHPLHTLQSQDPFYFSKLCVQWALHFRW